MSFDVCVIGSGVAGALAAYRLAAGGKSVVMLDSGPRFDVLDRELYEAASRHGDAWPWYAEDRDRCEESTSPRIGLNNNRVRAVGGTTLQWNAHVERLMPVDFRMRTAFGIGADWPLSYDELERWYCEAEKELGVAGEDAPGSPPRSEPYPMPPHPLSYAEREFVIPAFQRCGVSLGMASLAINSTEYGGRPACQAYATCIPMCPNHAKYTAMSHVVKAEATGRVSVRSNCHVRRLHLSERRSVGSVEYVDEEGSSQQEAAKVFLLAAGGVETPRLLLLSSNGGDLPNGLANGSGLVGRYYMTHPRITSRALLPSKIGPHRTGFNATMSWHLYTQEKRPRAGGVLLKPTVEGGPTPADLAIRSNKWGRDLMEEVKRRYGHEMGIHIQGDMLPAAENRMSLSTGSVDRFGDPVPRIEMKLGREDVAALHRGAEVASRVFTEMNAQEVHGRKVNVIGNHIIGTTRMGSDPKRSVCDAWGRCHELDNLYVAGSSLFPTAGCGSPTLTIAALSLRTADHIATRR
jgi:glucose dehydrogenase